MTQTLAMFPLEMVVFPQERLALHIFENRYQQLVTDCENENITFGIPAYINKKMRYGTQVRLTKVVNRYESGASDIVCQGLRIFRINDFKSTLNDKLYAGADIEFLPYVEDGRASQRRRFVILVTELYDVLNVSAPEVDPMLINSFSFAHKIGLSLEQEFNLIQIVSEAERLAFIIDHLSVTIPVIQQINRTKELIQMNGHFKNFDPLDFTEYSL